MSAKRFECNDCGGVFASEEELLPISDIEERVLPGERLPWGVCPNCDASVYAKKMREGFDDA